MLEVSLPEMVLGVTCLGCEEGRHEPFNATGSYLELFSLLDSIPLFAPHRTAVTSTVATKEKVKVHPPFRLW